MLVLFIAASFLSAFLLFSVEPLFAKMVLPVLGGSPSVWAVALCFFQAALLAGYGYAYLLMRYVPAPATGLVHIAIALAALVVLPIGLPSGWTEPPPGEPYFWQLGLFAVAVGLPFVAVAANAPLLQAWFALTRHPHARDPYFLYGASNFGSLIALLGYPFLFEPALGLRAMSRDWTELYVVLILALAVCFAVVRRYASADPQKVAVDAGSDASAPRPTRARPPRLVRARHGAGGAAHRVHDARRDRHRFRAAAVGAPARALPRDLHPRLPGPRADPDVGAAPAAARLRHLCPLRARADEVRQVDADELRRRRRLLPLGAARAPQALSVAAAGARPHPVLSVDVVWRRARRALLRASRAQAVLGDLRVPAADRADGRLPPRRVQAARGVTPRDALAARYRRNRPPACLVRRRMGPTSRPLVRRMGLDRGAHARARRHHARVLGAWRAPARSRARHVRDRRHAAVDREARECAAQLLRRLSRLAVGERRL